MLNLGAYIKMRRCAAGLGVADVVAQLTTEPHVDERARAEWLELVETDTQPVSVRTLVALRKVFPFNVEIAIALERIAQGSAERAPRLCRICACSEWDPCMMTDHACSWVAGDLCSAHAGVPGVAAIEAAA